MATELASLLQVPSIDALVAALLPNASIPWDPDKGLRPKERRLDHILQQAFQGAAWAIQSASMASFFNRTTLLWLRHLQENLTTEDVRVKQDLNKIIAFLQFSVDATLNVAQLAAKSLASSVVAQRLVWLCYWQADARHKWRLVSVPFSDLKLFGDALDGNPKFNCIPPVSNHEDLMGAVPPLLLLGSMVGLTPGRGVPRTRPPGVNLSCPNGPFVGEEVVLSDAAINCILDPPIGGHLALFANLWELSTTDKWVLATLRSDLAIELVSPPPMSFVCCPLSRNAFQ